MRHKKDQTILYFISLLDFHLAKGGEFSPLTPLLFAPMLFGHLVQIKVSVTIYFRGSFKTLFDNSEKKNCYVNEEQHIELDPNSFGFQLKRNFAS